jgi:hypothetical protein
VALLKAEPLCDQVERGDVLRLAVECAVGRLLGYVSRQLEPLVPLFASALFVSFAR